MRKLWYLLIVVFFIVGCTKPPKLIISAKLTFLSGDITILRKHNPQEVKLNMRLYPGDLIQTGKDSEVNILFANIGISKIRQNTEVSIQELWKSINGDQIRMDITRGRILSSLKKLTKEKGESRFEIFTPTAVVGVRGTTFIVNVEPKKHTKIAVFAGEVEIKGRAQIEKIVGVEELKEAILPQSDFERIRVVRMSDATFKELKSIEGIHEIEEYKLTETKEEIKESMEKWQQIKEGAAIQKITDVKKSKEKETQKNQKIKW